MSFLGSLAERLSTAFSRTHHEVPTTDPCVATIATREGVQGEPAQGLTHAQRARLYSAWLEQPDSMPYDRVRRIIFEYGLPEGHVRALFWRLLLGLLPPDPAQWDAVLAEHRAMYQAWHTDLKIDPHHARDGEAGAEAEMEVDHPLSLDSSSEWNAYFRDNSQIFEIEKDVMRTFPHLHFFQAPELSDSAEPVDEREAALRNPHYRALRAILFMWAKLNPGVAYVQGMNEIVGPIYYVFATDANDGFRQYAEHDAFFCFNNLMGEIMNNFMKTLDQSQRKDRDLWNDLEEKHLDPQFYSFRWITLLLSQEFELPEVLRLWDTLFADPHRFQHLRHVCVAMLIHVREELLVSDFSHSMRLLQSYPPVDMAVLLDLARQVADPDYRASTAPSSESDEVEVDEALVTQSSLFQFLDL